MIDLHKKFAFYIGNAIAWIGLCMIMIVISIGIYIYEKLSILFYVSIFTSILLFVISIYYLINSIGDYNIRKKGYVSKAIIIKVYNRKFRFSSNNVIIMYEYTDKNGCNVRTRENVNQFKHIFKKNDRIKVICNGKKALLDRTEYN